MNTQTKLFLRKKFQEYYRENKISGPPEIEKREFGEGTLEQKIKVRHKSFSSERELQNHLRREAPFFISYSSAYYEFPEEQPMSEKNWLGADLTFDLDIEMQFLEREKLEEVKRETMNLLDFLLTDFGFSKQEVKLNFSGHHGYHVHVFSDKIKRLGSEERKEIVDYVSGEINFRDFLRIEERGKQIKVKGPRKGERGWRGIIGKSIYQFIKNSSIKEMEAVKGIGKKTAHGIYQNKKKILRELEKGEYHLLPEIITIKEKNIPTADPNVKRKVIEEVSSPLIQKIINEVSIKTLASRDTDRMVSIDPSRLIRLPDSLHGGSGLIAKRVERIDDFNPLTDALAFDKEKIKIKLEKKIPKFDFFDGEVGPFKGKVKVPESLGIYLLLKKSGDLSS